MGRVAKTLACCIVLAGTLPTWAEQVAVAAAHPRGGASTKPLGAVFFLAIPSEPGAVAVGAAHSFDRTGLAEAGALEFRIGLGAARVATSTRYYAAPGRPFHKSGATLRDDYLTFALAERPQGIRLLEAARRLPNPSERVRILGIPADGRMPQAQLLGEVLRSDATRIEVELEAPADLRGWGGAPVLEAEGVRVLGLLQAAWPAGERMRLGVGPIAGVVEALGQPYEGGLGRLFADLAPPPSAATGHGARRRAATGSPFGDQAPERSAAEVIAAAMASVEVRGARGTRSLELEIEQPLPEAVVGDAAGVFVSGRALAMREGRRRFDIVIALDTSGSTREPTGVDVDGDGIVGALRPGALPGSPEWESSDPGDSILAAEVAAAGRLLAGLDPRTTRVGLVTFAGEPVEGSAAIDRRQAVRRAAQTEEPLTSDYERLRRALAGVTERGAYGGTHMAAGIDHATLELLGLEGSLSHADPESEKIVLFFTDGTPTLPHWGSESGNVRAVLEAAQRARRAGVRIHSFAIGPEALAGPISTVEMAAMTEGLFTPVRYPGSLVRSVEGVSFANIHSVDVRNASAGESAFQTRVHADGSWDALVPLREGRNEIEVRARSSDGAKATSRVTVHHVPGADRRVLPAELVPRYNALLEARLAGLRRERLDAERLRTERMRQELVLEIERERAAALERAARQRKELRLEVERPDGP